MRVDNAMEQARGARTHKQATRLYNGLEYELALGEHPADHEAEAERALEHLEQQFPGVKESARDSEEPPSLSRSSSRRLRQEGDRAHERVRERRQRREPQPRPQVARRRGGGTRAARQTAGRGLQVVDNATGGWGATIGDVFVWGAGLSIFYLLITKAAATGKLALGASNVVRAVVSPHVDPLNPKGIA